MMKPGAEVALLTPSAAGWRLEHARTVREAPSLAEVVALIPAATEVHLALPCHTALLERFSLPSADRTELIGMAELQLEKTLPYPLDEVTSDLEVVSTAGEESTVLSIAVHTPVLEEMCQPLREKEHLPTRITLYAQQVAAKAPADGVTLLLWKEQEQLVLAISEGGRLGWAQSMTAGDAEAFVGELPALLLGAEMNGVPTQCTRAMLAMECASLASAVTEVVGCPTETFLLAEVPPPDSGNLLPPGWADDASKQLRTERVKQRLLAAAVIYLVLIAVAFLFLAWKKRGMQTIDAQIARTRPLIEATQARQNRWEALAPALEPGRSAVEIVWLVYKSRPGPEVHITQLDCGAAQFMVEGEAPSAGAAIDFAERLRTEPGLSTYQVEAGPPQILPNERAQFRIFGKL